MPELTEYVFKEFDTGAVREDTLLNYRYDLIPIESLARLARRYAFGAKKYGENNYQKGLPYSDTFNHIMSHLLLYNSGDQSDDHLAAAMWGCATLMYFEERNMEGSYVCPGRGESKG